MEKFEPISLKADIFEHFKLSPHLENKKYTCKFFPTLLAFTKALLYNIIYFSLIVAIFALS